jgi:2-polyprenyl-3-methyl-5-hydroxy-6-metoxy-1,4-benzoquinol methylase
VPPAAPAPLTNLAHLDFRTRSRRPAMGDGSFEHVGNQGVGGGWDGVTVFDEHERLQWRGAGRAYHGSFARLCAHPAPTLLDAAGVEPGVRVLDVGTGTGTVAALACSRGAEVVAVDAEPSMVELAGHQAPAAEIRLATLPHLPFADSSFDAAVANFVLNHVGDPAAAELHRMVCPGGRIAVTIWPAPPA